MQVLTTDVAIVGGGAAGCYAALNLNRTGVETIVVSKGLVGKSGASIFAGNLVLGGRLLGNTEENARNTAEFLVKYHNQFLIDQNWARRCGQWIENVYYPELEEAGLYFRRDDDGNVVTSPGKIRSIAANVQGNSGVPFMDLRRKQIMRAKIACLEESAVTALLLRPDGSVGGVFALRLYLRRIRRRARARRHSGYRLLRPPACALDWHSRNVRRRDRDGMARRRSSCQSRNAVVAHQ